MAIDSAKKRRSALGAGGGPGTNLPLPDGAIDAADRATLAGVYGSAFDPPPQAPPAAAPDDFSALFAVDYSRLSKRKHSRVDVRFIKQVLAVARRSDERLKKHEQQIKRLEQQLAAAQPKRTAKDLYARPVSARRHA